MSSFVPEDNIPKFHPWKDESANNPFSAYLLCLPDNYALAVTSLVAILVSLHFLSLNVELDGIWYLALTTGDKVTYAGAQTWTLFRFLLYASLGPDNSEQGFIRHCDWH